MRDTTTATRWRGGPDAFTVDKGAGVMIIAPAFHRDPDLLPSPDSFTPDIWLDGRAQQYPQLVPFRAGPVEGPGRNVVLFTTSTLLAHIFAAAELDLRCTPRLDPAEPLPATRNPVTLDFAVTARAAPVDQ